MHKMLLDASCPISFPCDTLETHDDTRRHFGCPQEKSKKHKKDKDKKSKKHKKDKKT